MAFVSVNKNLKSFVKPIPWKDLEANDYIVGTYEDCSNTDKFGKPIFGFKVVESNIGITKGEMVYLNSGGNFQNDMSELDLEALVKVTYLGQAEIKKGKWAGSKTHNIKVEVDSKAESDDELI